MRISSFIFFFVFALFFAFAFNNCSDINSRDDVFSSKETDLGNPLVGFSTTAFQAPSGFAGLMLCLSELEAVGSTGSVTVPFEMQTGLSTQGTTLGTAALPAGTYTGLKLKLSSNCLVQNSIQFANSSGNFVSSENITLSFSGTFLVGNEGGSAALDVQPLVTALNAVATQDQVVSQSEGATGSIAFQQIVAIYWTGQGGDNFWDNPANWLSGQGPDQVPGPNNSARFYGEHCSSNCNVVVRTQVTVGAIDLKRGFPGSLTVNSSGSLSALNSLRIGRALIVDPVASVTVYGDLIVQGGGTPIDTVLNVYGDVRFDAQAGSSVVSPPNIEIRLLGSRNATVIQELGAYGPKILTVNKTDARATLSQNMIFEGGLSSLLRVTGDTTLRLNGHDVNVHSIENNGVIVRNGGTLTYTNMSGIGVINP